MRLNIGSLPIKVAELLSLAYNMYISVSSYSSEVTSHSICHKWPQIKLSNYSKVFKDVVYSLY